MLSWLKQRVFLLKRRLHIHNHEATWFTSRSGRKDIIYHRCKKCGDTRWTAFGNEQLRRLGSQKK